MSLEVGPDSSVGSRVSPPYSLPLTRSGNAHLHGLVAAADVGLVDEDVRNALLSGHLQQHLLVVGSILYTNTLARTPTLQKAISTFLR